MVERIDLHIHSTCSDGVLSPKEIIDKAIQNGVSIISITDHDTIDAYNDELHEYAKMKNIKLINGVEISAKVGKATIHVLGYNFDINNKELKEKLYMIRNARHIYLHDVSKKLNELGYIINTEELDKIDSITKSLIAEDVVKNKQNEAKLLDVFGYIPSRGEFIEKIMNFGYPGYVNKQSITPKDATEIIRNAGGKVVLAHPVVYKYIQKLTENEILEIAKVMNAEGIEANYIYIDTQGIKINEVDKWNEFAEEHNFFVTVGSDFHNTNGNYVEIGLLDEEIDFSKIILENLVDNK